LSYVAVCEYGLTGEGEMYNMTIVNTRTVDSVRIHGFLARE
jgi:hypothetical protein